jgi:hypothetical protein
MDNWNMKTLVLLLVAAPIWAQLHYPKHNFTVGLGAGLPGGDLSGLFQNKPGVSVGYGYRFQRYFQADIGMDAVFGAAGVRDFLPTQFGSLRIRDFQYMVPFGGRVVLPVSAGRVLFSGGGGGVYARYSERLRQPTSDFRFECPVCESRSGWGNYALAGVSVALDHYQRFRVGATSKFYRVRTNGGPLGFLPGVETQDRWVNLFGDLTITF